MRTHWSYFLTVWKRCTRTHKTVGQSGLKRRLKLFNEYWCSLWASTRCLCWSVVSRCLCSHLLSRLTCSRCSLCSRLSCCLLSRCLSRSACSLRSWRCSGVSCCLLRRSFSCLSCNPSSCCSGLSCLFTVV